MLIVLLKIIGENIGLQQIMESVVGIQPRISGVVFIMIRRHRPRYFSHFVKITREEYGQVLILREYMYLREEPGKSWLIIVKMERVPSCLMILYLIYIKIVAEIFGQEEEVVRLFVIYPKKTNSELIRRSQYARLRNYLQTKLFWVVVTGYYC